jgi:DNA repair exonuclease SbcCD ATPase subunit
MATKDIDALFQLPLAEFTAARNGLAARLKKTGHVDEAGRVKALPKPTATAWAVNQIYWRHPKDIDRLIALSEKVRAAPANRDLLDERRHLLSELTKRAAAILREGGHADSPDAMRRMTITLESLTSWGRTDSGPQTGRLSADLEALGFDGLAALLGGRKLEPGNVIPFRRATKPVENPAAARARIQEAIKAAEKRLREAEREADRAAAALEKANARVEAVEKQKQEIDAKLAQVKDEARAVSAESRKAAQDVLEARRALERARGMTT